MMKTLMLLCLAVTACGPLEHPPCETSDAGVIDAGQVDAGPSCTSCFCDPNATLCAFPPVDFPCCEGLADGVGGVKP